MRLSMKELQKIPSHYRPAPFWSWNDELEPEELRRQIRQMHEAGLGGFFMHARSGLRTEYMGEKWMQCVKACIDEAVKCGMDPWLYDENGWPSGFGGGMVNGLGEKYQQKYLRCRRSAVSGIQELKHLLGYYSCDGRHRYGTTLPDGVSGEVLELYYEVNPFYVDNLDAEVVAQFLKCTHDRYADSLTAEEMQSIRGIFTDEPQLSRDGTVWSSILPEEYEKSYHRDLLDDIPFLFVDTDKSPSIRIHYWSLCARLFSMHFIRQIAEWCEAHGWQLTGHQVLEEGYWDQLTPNGSVMQQYRYYHVPGMDQLCRLETNVMTMMQVVSVAAQTGRSQILSETFAATGWSLNMRGMKWMFQQQMAHGVNYLCQHLAPYSMRGMRKRDYPLGSGCQSPWWKDYRILNDCFGRVGMLLAEGEIHADVLVVHGQSTAWTLFNDKEECRKLIQRFSESLNRLSQSLDGYRVSYHYADEMMLKELGGWKDGNLKVGMMSYQAVVLPQLLNISRETFEMLSAMVKAGRPVYGVRNHLAPGNFLIDGVPATQEERQLLCRICWLDNEEAAAHAVSRNFIQPVVLEYGENAPQMLCAVRSFENLCGRSGVLYFIVNSRPEAPCCAQVKLPGGGAVESIDMASGEFSPVKCVSCDGMQCLDWSFATAEAALFFVHDKGMQEAKTGNRQGIMPELHKAGNIVPQIVLPSEKWHRVGTARNILVLDQCEYRVDGGGWIADEVSAIHDALLRLKRNCRLDMRFAFECTGLPDAPISLGLENPGDYTALMLNGVPFVPEDTGNFLFDKSIRLMSMPKVKIGRNVLELTMDYHQRPEVFDMIERARKFETEFNMRCFDSEVENIYLAGDFKVGGTLLSRSLDTAGLPGNLVSGYIPAVPVELWRAPFAIQRADESVNIADTLESGYPFLAGELECTSSFSLTKELAVSCNALSLECRGFNSVEVKINGRVLGTLCWEPYVLTIPQSVLKDGKNDISIRMTASFRNMLGPFHSTGGDPASVWVLAFNKKPNVLDWPAPPWQPDYSLASCGVDKITLGNF